MAMGREESKTIRAITIKCGVQKLVRCERTSSGGWTRIEIKDERPSSSSSSSLSSSSSTITSSSSAPAPPWNLRSSSRAAAVADGGGSEKSEDHHSLTNTAENGDGMTKSRVSSEKPGTCTVTVPLSKSEIDEDYMLLFGEPAPLKPKNKRPKKVQKTLDTLYPGLRLKNISIDSYKISKSRENGKK